MAVSQYGFQCSSSSKVEGWFWKANCIHLLYTTSAEKKYAQIEKEGLAMIFAVTKCYQYLYGRPLNINSDHQPPQVSV